MDLMLFFTHDQKIIRQGLCRLNVFQRPGNDSHRVRHENLERSIKKIKTFYWKRKKLEHVEVGIWKILRSKIFKIFDLKIFHFHTNFNENFRKFWDRKFSKFLISIFFIFDLKNFHFHTNFNENFREKNDFFRSQKISDANFNMLQLFSFSIKSFDFFYRST